MSYAVPAEFTPASVPLQASPITPKLARHEVNDREVPATVRKSRRMPVSSDSLHHKNSAILEVAPSGATSANGVKTGSTDTESVAVTTPTLCGEIAQEPEVYDEERFTTNENRTFETVCLRFGIRDNAVHRIGQAIHHADFDDGKFGRTEGITINHVLKGWAKQGIPDDELLRRGWILSKDSIARFHRN